MKSSKNFHYIIILWLSIWKVEFTESQSQIRFRVVEECSIKTVIGNIHSEIFKHDPTNPNEYSYKPFSNTDPFSIESKTHKLFVLKRVDREAICKYQSRGIISDYTSRNCEVNFKVIQRKINDNMANVMLYLVKIEILDINDNAPTWPSPKVHFDLAEHSKLDTKLALPLANDPDQAPMNTTKTYKISHQSVHDGFILHHLNAGNKKEALWLVVNKDFDREIQPTVNVKIDAFDGGPQPLTGHLDINISLTDINDKIPKFTTINVHKTIPENTPLRTKILKLEATDDDESNKNSLTFQFDNSVDEAVRNRFSINSNNGEIYTAGYIDYEVRPEYIIPVTVSDGKHLDRTTVIITVENINDNPPEISVMYVSGMEFETPRQSSQYRSLVAENRKPGFVVATFSVSDKDQVTSSLNDNNRHFNNRFNNNNNYGISCKINSKDEYLELKQFPQQMTDYFKIVTTKQFDREKSSQYFAQLICFDSGTISKSTSVNFEISITDVNDNRPIFKIPSQESRINPTYSIKEGLPVGSIIIRVKAIDYDIGVNANIEYSLDSMSSKFFNIDSLNGEIRSGQVFDYEVTQEFELTVNASNPLTKDIQTNTSIQLFTLKKIFINIEDVNDCPPVFSKDLYSFDIKEGPSKDVYVGRVDVTDADKSTKFNTNYFRILPTSRDYFTSQDPNPSDYFRIGEIGFIYVNVPVLDREKVNSFSFPVSAADRSDRPLSSTALVQIRIIDVNDNPPQWIFPSTHSYTVNVSYQEAIGHRIAQLKTTDPDYGENGKVKYRIVAPPYRQSPKLNIETNNKATDSQSYQSDNINRQDIFELESFTGSIYIAQKMSLNDLGPKAIWLEASDQGSPPMKAYERLLVYIVNANREDSALTGSYGNNDNSGKYDKSFGLNKNGFENDLMIMIVLVAIIILVAMVMVVIILMLRCRNANRTGHSNKMVRDSSHSTNLAKSFMERRPDGHSCSPVNDICPPYPGPKRSQTISTYLGQSLPGSSQLFDFTTGYLTEPNSRTQLDMTGSDNMCDSSCQSMNRNSNNNFNSGGTFAKKYYTSSALYRHNNLWPNENSPSLSKRFCHRLNNEPDNVHNSLSPMNDSNHDLNDTHITNEFNHQNTTKKSVTLPNFLSAIEECEDGNTTSITQKPLIPSSDCNVDSASSSLIQNCPTSSSTFKNAPIDNSHCTNSNPLDLNSQHRLSVTWLDKLWVPPDSHDLHQHPYHQQQQQQQQQHHQNHHLHHQPNQMYKSVDSCLNERSQFYKDHEYTQLRVMPPSQTASQDQQTTTTTTTVPQTDENITKSVNTNQNDYPVTYV